jgi:hypothetical protein
MSRKFVSGYQPGSDLDTISHAFYRAMYELPSKRVDERSSYFMARFMYDVLSCDTTSTLSMGCLVATLKCIGGACDHIDMAIVSWVSALSKISMLEFCCIGSYLTDPPLTAKSFATAKLYMSERMAIFDDESATVMEDEQMLNVVNAMCGFVRLFRRNLRSDDTPFESQCELYFAESMRVFQRVSKIMLKHYKWSREDIIGSPMTLVCEDFSKMC